MADINITGGLGPINPAAFSIPVSLDQTISQGSLIIQQFGLNVLKTGIYKAAIGPNQDTRDLALSGGKGTSKLSTPIFTNLEIVGTSYTKDGVLYAFQTVILETVLMTVSQTKNIVTTAVQGRNGSVKEYISDGDYTINIKGLLTGSNGVYPKADTRALKVALNAPIPLKVNSWFLQNLDIDNIVVTDYALPQQEGWYTTQMFDIQCISDKPIDLILK
jgi:hypothetical protein